MSVDAYKIDSHKLHFHPHRVAQWMDSKGDWEKAKKLYPVYVEISPSGACQHRCTFCAVDYLQYKPVLLDTDVLIKRLQEMAALGIKSVMFAGEGEPLLHKHIGKITFAAAYAGLDVAFTTNGVLLDRLFISMSRARWVKVSVNAGTEATYRAVHKAKKGDWEKVWENLAEAKRHKAGCTLGVQMVCLPENAGEEEALQEKCDEAGVDYLVFKPYSQHKSSITRQYEGYKPIRLPSNGRTIVRHEAIATRKHEYEKCHATPNFWAYCMANGDVYSCSAYLLDERFRLGNLNDETFQAIWEGERRKANWELVSQSLDISECRVNCRMDKVNRYLWGFDHQQHINFI